MLIRKAKSIQSHLWSGSAGDVQCTEVTRAQCVKRGGVKLFYFSLVFKFFLAPKWFETAMFQMCHSSDFVLI